MPSLLDAFPYPWPERDAQLLHRRMVELYPDPAEARGLVSRLGGIDVFAINFQKSPLLFWDEILTKGAVAGRVRALAQLVLDASPAPCVATFLHDLLADRTPLRDPEPRGARSEPRFNDKVNSAEALLFYQDLSEAIALVPRLLTGAQNALARAGSVCRLRVTVASGAGYAGTGFRITTDRILTNHHVLFPDGTGATAVVADFGYELDALGRQLSGTSIECDCTTIVAAADDDWGVISAAGIDGAIPAVSLTDGRVPEVGERAFIVQHPGGAPKRLGFVRNRITQVTGDRVRYLTDTAFGSSGSPVFDADGRIVALHHAGGTPQATLGHDPAQKNEGIRIDRVLAQLEAARIL